MLGERLLYIVGRLRLLLGAYRRWRRRRTWVLYGDTRTPLCALLVP
jgi:hypothetical protein